jgi:uncharacterized membrane protein YgcG
MKRIIITLLATLSIILFPLPAFADANDFDFTSLDTSYYLSKDSEGRSMAKVTETFVAEFPQSDQNHGIERAIPQIYDNHPVDVSINSVTNDAGQPWNYTTYTSNDNLVIRIGNANSYLHGFYSFKIAYTLRDVTTTVKDTGRQEFYWNINGTQWQQSFGIVTASVVLDPSIAGRFDGQTTCYTGSMGSMEKACTINSADGQATTVFATTRPLQAGENLSIVMGFQPGTFNAYVQPPIPIWLIIVGALIAVAVVMTQIVAPIWLLRLAHRTWKASGKDVASKGIIVPQYSQPAGHTILEDSVALNEAVVPVAISATYIDLAVRGYLRLTDLGKRPLGGNDFQMEIMKPVDDLAGHERAALSLLFGSLEVGAQAKTASQDNKYKGVEALKSSVYDEMIKKGFFADTKAQAKKLTKWGLIFTIGSFFIAGGISFIAGVITLIYASKMSARTTSGVELRDYLLGNKMYMEVAETDRIRTLQSVAGAERIDTSDAMQVVKLYEKLLPLAMLFGIEKQWAQQFPVVTSDYQPDWYQSNSTAFNTALLGSSLNGFSQTLAASTFAPPASTGGGGSGFSGGSSGGGGGGGGGGGW